MKFTSLLISLLSIGLAHAQQSPEVSSTTNLRGSGEKNGNEMDDHISGQGLTELDNNEHRRAQGTLGDWAFCSDSSQCANRCCSTQYSTSDGRLKCTPGGTICTTTKLGDWAFCTSNSQCQNNCCSNQYSTSDGRFKCTPGGTICTGSTGPSSPTPRPTPPPTSTTGGLTITSPAITLTTRHVQAGISRKGDNVAVSQAIVDSLNRVTRGYTLYRQLAFVAHTIWESGSYQFKKELDTNNYGNYQECDWNRPGVLPNNGKQYYGRGYLQLSWCANYRAYGASRNFNNDPNLFYNQPELLETNEFYAMDSGAWYFESSVTDRTGQFGLTTKAINGPLECSSGSTLARQRYEIFVAIATTVGMTGYSEGGCYN